ncbi:OsmC family peroxiredoxin [Propionivibrio soli]|uniref:OsmC family peroxiredoxin n=1 Tax=Propionivibrio soli TaxID=2976531 RepID=UPI0021E822C2|nr:OsmC family peroxiredoxin [Propionivibrio soli]
MKRTAWAAWAGRLKDGIGSISTESGVLSNTRYGYGSRFGNSVGTNPEELVGAALAGCFSMALVSQLEESGLRPESMRTEATVTMEQGPGGYSIPAIHLSTVAKVPGATRQGFEAAAAQAQAGCPVSKLVKARVTLAAKLED